MFAVTKTDNILCLQRCYVLDSYWIWRRPLLRLNPMHAGKTIQQTKVWIIYRIFPENRFWYFMQIVSFAWNAKTYFLGKIRKIWCLSRAEFAQRAITVNAVVILRLDCIKINAIATEDKSSSPSGNISAISKLAEQRCRRIYPKYWDTLSTYHTCPKIWNSPFYYLLMCQKYCYCCVDGKQWRPWSDAAFCGVWSGSTLFAKAYLSRYLEFLR